MTQPIKQHFLEQLRDNARDILIETSETSLYEEETEVEEPIHNILRTLIGHLQVDLGMHNEALSNLDSGGLSSQEKFLICITKEFVLAIKENSFSPTSFLAWAASKGNVSALHAYRLLVHFMHESYWNQYTYDNKQEINEALSLNTGGSATVIRNRYHEGVYGNGPGVEMKGKHDNNDSVYTWIENPENEQSTKFSTNSSPARVALLLPCLVNCLSIWRRRYAISLRPTWKAQQDFKTPRLPTRTIAAWTYKVAASRIYRIPLHIGAFVLRYVSYSVYSWLACVIPMSFACSSSTCITH